MDALLENIQIVPKDVLLHISKGPLLKFARECKNDQQVNHLWQSLLQTFSTRSISRLHTTTVCNAVSAFLDASLSSVNSHTRHIALSHETWLAVFDIYVTRFEDSTPKPMKQVLSCLVRILKKHPDVSEAEIILTGAANVMLPSIMLSDPKSQLKACLVALESLVREKAIASSRLMPLIYDWLVTHYQLWEPLFKSHCERLSMNITHFAGPVINYNDVEDKVKYDVFVIFCLGLLLHTRNQGYSSSAGSMLSLFSQKANLEYESQQTSPPKSYSPSLGWVSSTRYIMLENMNCLDLMSHSVLYPLFASNTDGFRSFINSFPLRDVLSGDMKDEGSIDEFTLLFSTLQIAKKLGLVYEDHCFGKPRWSTQDETDPIILDSQILGGFLSHREQSIRVSALSLLITASSTTKPVSAAALKAILSGLPSMHTDSDAQSRGEILSLIRKLLVRLRGTQKTHSGSAEGHVYDTRDFLDTYVKFLERELRSTSSYPRHIIALKSLVYVLNTGVDPRAKSITVLKGDAQQAPWRFSMNILSSSLLRLLIDLLMDPFEDVRGVSQSILGLFPSDFSDSASELSGVSGQLVLALSKAESLASNTSRADYADTVARLYHSLFTIARTGNIQSPKAAWYGSKGGIADAILEKLEDKLAHPGSLFSSLIRDAPLHGYVSALRYLVATPEFYTLIGKAPEETNIKWKNVHSRIVTICNRLWLEVKPVLCIDSPEGHTGEALDDLMVGPKDILSYSWRALRESSLLLHAIVANTSYGPRDRELGLQRTHYEEIGTLSFTQLSELRHRGAFSTVSQTFAMCCQRCGQNTDTAISNLPEVWYQEAVRIIWENASKLTRRSAGLPALVTGILLSNPGGPLFQRVMSELTEISRLPVTQQNNYSDLSLPQVHAMNCLKDILIDTNLGPYTEPFIMPVLTLSADSLSSSIWAIRNCGLMLFGASMTRMCRLDSGTTSGFGGDSGVDSGMRIVFQRYPSLVQLLSKLLRPDDQSQGPRYENNSTETERVFPALEIIREKVPSSGDDDDAKLRQLVLQQVNSTIWAIREQAARVWASLLRPAHILDAARSLLEGDVNVSSQNYLHGKLLCIRFSLLRLWASSHGYWRDHFETISSTILDSFTGSFAAARSPFAQAAMIDILADAYEKTIQFGIAGELANFLDKEFGSDNLEDLLRDLMDQSHGESRAASLLRRSVTWSMMLKAIVKQSPDLSAELYQVFSDISVVDSDAACWTLRRMNTIFTGYEIYQKGVLTFYSSIVSNDHREDVKASAILNLAAIVEDLLDRDLTPELPAEVMRLRDHIFTLYQEQVWGREMVESALRLQGCLVTLQYSSDPRSANIVFDLGRWAVSLRFAMSEETVFTTRYAAVMSLKTFSHVLRKPGASTDTSPVLLEFYLILYDMLNDDDEELRDMATTIASWVLSYSSMSPDKAVSWGTLIASDYLVDFIASNYSSSPFLFREAVKRLVGQGAYRRSLGRGKGLKPVSSQLSELRKESSILFEEEKQNLFIDDVRESDNWTRVLLQLDTNTFQSVLVNRLFEWVSDGLGYLIDIASSSDRNDQDDLLGWTSKPEIYTLGVQVFCVATLFVSRDLSINSDLPDVKTTISEKLGLLFEKGQSIALHPHWLSRVKSVIDLA